MTEEQKEEVATEDEGPGGFELEDAIPVEKLEDKGLEVEIMGLDGEWIIYKGENGTDSIATIKVVGTYSTRYRRAQETQTTKTLRKRSTSNLGRDLGERRIELVASCVLGWDGFFHKGTPIPFNRNNVVKVLEAAPWVREQLENAMENHEAFLRGNLSN